MQVDKHKVVTIDYTLQDDSGNVIDSSEDGSFAYLHGADNIIPGLENALAGRSAGDELAVSVSPWWLILAAGAAVLLSRAR